MRSCVDLLVGLTSRHAVSSSPIGEALAAITADLEILANELRWCHANAYWPAGRALDAPPGTSLAKPADPNDPDHVPGPERDVGIGDFASRMAWHSAVAEVAQVEVRLALALAWCGRTEQPRVVAPGHASSIAVVLQVVANCVWRVRELEAIPVAGLERIVVKAVRTHVEAARKATDAAVRDLSRALHRGPASGIAHAEKPCRTCKVRPMAERERSDGTRKPSRHGECETCAKWRQRNKGPRPAEKLDREPLREARAAQMRRHQRGEGWGSA